MVRLDMLGNHPLPGKPRSKKLRMLMRGGRNEKRRKRKPVGDFGLAAWTIVETRTKL